MRTLKIIILLLLFPLILSATPDSKKDYLIRIKFSEKTLILFENNIKVKQYQIATPFSNWYPLPLIGEITRIEYNPIWYPTTKTRIAYARKKGINLPTVVGPNDSKNALGKVKFIIHFQNAFQDAELIQLHGTNDPSSIGKKVTRGCIRMHNKDALELAKKIENQLPVRIIVE